MTMNPIFESSARRRMRTGKTPVVLTLYLAALLMVSLCLLTDFMGRGTLVSDIRKSTEWTIWVTALQFFLIILVAPALSAGSIAGERERQTFDLLLVTGVGVRKIVLGKLMEHFAFLLVLIAGGFPVMMLANVTGGMPISDILMILLYLAVFALGALAVGMVASVLFKRTLTAIIISYLSIFAIGFGTWALAKQGPFAAQYTYTMFKQMQDQTPMEILATLPKSIFLNPAVVLVMLLAGQTGILNRTMETTMRLMDIYTAAKQAGFSLVAGVGILSIFAAAILLIMLAVLILYIQTGKGKTQKLHR